MRTILLEIKRKTPRAGKLYISAAARRMRMERRTEKKVHRRAATRWGGELSRKGKEGKQKSIPGLWQHPQARDRKEKPGKSGLPNLVSERQTVAASSTSL